MQIVISSQLLRISRESAQWRVSLILICKEARGTLSVEGVMCATNLDRDLNEPRYGCRKYEKRGLMPSTIAIFILHHEQSPVGKVSHFNTLLKRKCLQNSYSTLKSKAKARTRHDQTELQEKEICPYLAKIWTLPLGASQFTIYMVCFTRRIIIQRLEFSQLSPKFPGKRGVVAILCSKLGMTGDQ